MTMQVRKLGWVAIAGSLALSLAACGGGSEAVGPGGNSPPVVTPPDTTPETVSGIALPSSVAVVTATNAN